MRCRCTMRNSFLDSKITLHSPSFFASVSPKPQNATTSAAGTHSVHQHGIQKKERINECGQKMALGVANGSHISKIFNCRTGLCFFGVLQGKSHRLAMPCTFKLVRHLEVKTSHILQMPYRARYCPQLAPPLNSAWPMVEGEMLLPKISRILCVFVLPSAVL